MVSGHLAEAILHNGFDDFQVGTMDDLFKLEWIKDRLQQFLVIHGSDGVALDSADPETLKAEAVNLCDQLVTFLVIVINHSFEFF